MNNTAITDSAFSPEKTYCLYVNANYTVILTFTDKRTGLLKNVTATTSVYIYFFEVSVFGFMWYNKTGIWLLFLLSYDVSGNMFGIIKYSSITIFAAKSQNNNVRKPVTAY